jgi:hypothetical protein
MILVPREGTAMFSAVSGTVMRSTAMAAEDPTLDFFPRESRGRIAQQLRLSAGQFLFLPVHHRHVLGGRCKVIPQVFYKLEFLGRAGSKTEVIGGSIRAP